MARYESYLQHTEHKYTEEKRITLSTTPVGVVSEELRRKDAVQSYKGVLGPVAREDILAMRTIATACRVL